MTKYESAGQPQYYKEPEQMQIAIDAYFDSCTKDDGETPVTITGLALALGFTSRQALNNYENYSPEFFDTVKGAKSLVEMAYEHRLIKRGNGGDIFALKQFDWTDKQEIDHRQRYVDKDDNDIHAQDKAILDNLGLKK